ncbi:hypothetical protein LSUE1_G000952 [Lachnellula suecica]|uniref:ABM domain-containing protein n=1 Tax=Lachnellula suecica TaxID=602035 RepID=A0A8T9CG42_9HELO|nr:hypothetical protein LSUE1_G000952 [Lachnellula suecica]
MPITERLTLSVKLGVDEWKEQVKFLLQTLKKQEGNIRTRWGPHAEDESKLEFLIGWESADAQAKFQASPDFEAVMAQLKTVMTGPPTVYFVEFKPYAPPAIIDAAYVQVITLDSLSGSANEDALKGSMDVFTGQEGCTGVTSGLSTGTDKRFVGVVGWTSLEASDAATSKFAVTDGQMSTCRVNFRFPVKGFRGL